MRRQRAQLSPSSGPTAITVRLAELNPLTVPYVNRFIAPSGQVIIKDWRTGQYRTKVRRGGTARSDSRRLLQPPVTPHDAHCTTEGA